jgi:PAS domain S-box-containing protein
MAQVTKILIVDDEPRMCDSLDVLLSHCGYEVCKSNCAKEAMERVARDDVDLVLLDVVMPDTDGWALLDSMARQKPDTPVIAMTGQASLDSAADALKKGACDYLKKPFDHEDLIRRVEQALRVTKFSREEITTGRNLELSERRYRCLVEACPDIIYTLDDKGRFTFINKAMEKMLGFKRDHLMGRSYTCIIYEEDLDRADHLFNERRSGERGGKGVELRLRVDGKTERPHRVKERYVPVELKATGLYERTGTAQGRQRFLGSYGVARDLRDRKAREEKVQKSEERYRMLFENSPVETIIVDQEGRVIGHNVAEGGVGEERPRIGDVMYEDFRSVQDIDMLGELRRCMRRGYPKEFPEQRCGDKILHVKISPFADGAIITSIDVAFHRKLGAQLQRAQKMEAVGTLAGGIAHDFNNLLMAILGNISLMLHHLDSDHPFYARLKRVEENVKTGAVLTKQLLGYARKGQYDIRLMDLNALVSDTAYAFGRTRKETTVHTDLAEGLYPVKADQGQMEQVLLNLYVNATDAMPGGGSLFLKTRNATHREMKGAPYAPRPGAYAMLTVTDTGTGMDRETQERVFDPFFTTKEMGRGTGLGLASAYGIIKSHGGYIDVSSEKGRGATFRIFLPAAEKASPETCRRSQEMAPTAYKDK